MENFYHYCTFLKYYWPFRHWIYKDWHYDGHMVKEDVTKILKQMDREKFVEYMAEKYDSKYPRIYNIYWAFKYACGVSKEGYEYTLLNMYFRSIDAGIRSVPKWMVNDFPTETMMPGLIPCTNAINERKNDLKYEIVLGEWPSERFIRSNSDQDKFDFEQERCNMIDWLIENCQGEWYEYEFCGQIKLQFTNESDALGFKMAWT